MTIVYILESLVPQGGTERIITEKANYFAEQYKYDIYLVTCTQQQDQANAFPLSPSVKQIKLGIPYYSQYRYKYPKRLFVKLSLNRKLKKAVTAVVQQINPDILIGIGHYQADFVCSINCQAKKIIECHETRQFTLREAGEKRSWLSRMSTFLLRHHYFKAIEKKADAVVTLTEGDRKEWERARQATVIPNFSTMSVSAFSNSTPKRIIAVGRLEWEKGYERMIDIWENVSSRQPEWTLDIFGDGTQCDSLQTMIQQRGIKGIHLHHATNQISKEFANSSICVLTSYFEGFSLVLLEALKHGVPCVAYDCPYGPASIIEDAQCGYLIEDGNAALFIEKLNDLMQNDALRKAFSQNALERTKAFDTDVTMKKWMDLFENITCLSADYLPHRHNGQ